MRLLPLFLVLASFASTQDRPNYALAERFSGDYVRQRTYSSSVSPQWIGETDRFWYDWQNRDGWHYTYVDPAKNERRPLFDRDHLVEQLSVATRKPLEAETLMLNNAYADEEGLSLRFFFNDHTFELDLTTEKLTDLGKTSDEHRKHRTEARERRNSSTSRSVFFPGFGRGDTSGSSTHRVFSPDYTAYVFSRGHDLYFVEADEKVKEKIAEITARIEKEEEEAKAKEEAEETEDESATEAEEEVEDKKDDEEKSKVKTVQVRYKNGRRLRMETDERRIWAEAVDESNAIRLTEDGEDDYGFSGRTPYSDGQASDFEYDDYAWDLEAPDEEESKALTRPSIRWSPDSTAFYVTRRDTREIPDLWVLDSIAEPRPTLQTYDYPMPGEEKVRRTELYLFDRSKVALTKFDSKWTDEQYRSMHWVEEEEGSKEPAPAELRLLRQDRLVRNLEYLSVIPSTGESKTLLEEGFDSANVTPQSPRYLEDRDQYIWWSDRTGWGHFYLYDGEGKLLNAITSGKWRASRIVDVDEEKGLLFLRGNGKEQEENVYYEHLYRVHLDGSGLACLDPGNSNHRSVLSPTKSYVVDNCSRIDEAPCAILRDANGAEVIELEEMDLSRLYEAGWEMPETFRVKAADGVTDLFGNMWKPFDFDPKKQYPIIAEVYPGPQTEGVSHTFSSVNGRQQLAQVGFIVVQVGHRGGTPGRSKAYHSYGYFNLRDYGLEDKKVALEQLAERHPWIDIDRVGLYGHSGGGFMTAAAMMVPPYNDFFKVGVSSAGNHDNNIYNNYWSERYHGLKEVEKDGEKNFDIHIPTTPELAANLKGNLLLVHGEIDNNVHPANTMRLVDALIKADKRFDLLIIPGARHGFGAANGYFTHKRWEFFAEHLLGDHQRGADIRSKD